MKILHSVIVTPYKCGLYETTRELVVAERELGVDARIADPNRALSGVDREAPIVHDSFVRECDLLVSHSGLSKIMREAGCPMIHVRHGRPRSSFLLEVSGKIHLYSYLRQQVKSERFRAFVTFWPEFLPYWSMILPPEKLHILPPPVDLKAWTPNGPCGYGFHGKKGEINVVCTDAWRIDKDPFYVVHGFAMFAQRHPEARLHVYGNSKNLRGWAVLLGALAGRGVLGEIGGWVKGLDNVYRAADMLITPHKIATRSVREALACGCQVVAGLGNQFTKYTADEEDPEQFSVSMERAWEDVRRDGEDCKVYNRMMAKSSFDPELAARGLVEIFEKVLSEVKV